jgi:glutamate/tyrosine decarboxylase-like PLP-dependent enzyme
MGSPRKQPGSSQVKRSQSAPPSPLDLDHATMRRLGHRVTDLVADHLASLRDQPVQQSLTRRETEPLVTSPAPETGRSFDELVAFLEERVFPFHAREPHPRFLAYIPSCPTFPAVLGDWIATGYNFFAGVWPVAAAPNAVELQVLEWFRGWAGMPPGTGGLLTSGGSAATFAAVVAARHAIVGEDATRLPRLVMYASDQAHSSAPRAAWMAGISRAHVRLIASDERYRMRSGALADAIRRDREAGLLPFLVVGTAGSTSTGAVDPLNEIADLCEAEGLWLHVDAAYAGFANLTSRGRGLLDGLGRATSLTLDPHKWLFVPFECGCLLARNPRALADAFRIYPEYLKDVESAGEAINFADYGEQLTRYSRALKVWLSVNYFGLAAIRGAIERGMDLAAFGERLLRETPAIEITSPASFGIVCFRACPPGMTDPAALDSLNERVNSRVNREGGFLISSTRLGGVFSLRFCVVGYRATEDDIRELVAAVNDAVRTECAS